MRMNLQYFSEPQNNPTEGIQNSQAEGAKPQEGEKTFTQEDVNRIVGKRLAEEKTKSEADLERREKELKQKELDYEMKTALHDKRLPEELKDFLKYSDTDSIKAAVDYIANLKGYTGEVTTIEGTGHADSGGVWYENEKGVSHRIREAMGLH